MTPQQIDRELRAAVDATLEQLAEDFTEEEVGALVNHVVAGLQALAFVASLRIDEPPAVR